jgi:hypothetical protein
MAALAISAAAVQVCCTFFTDALTDSAQASQSRLRALLLPLLTFHWQQR